MQSFQNQFVSKIQTNDFVQHECVLKNTFLNIVDAEAAANKGSAQRRSLSEGSTRTPTNSNDGNNKLMSCTSTLTESLTSTTGSIPSISELYGVATPPTSTPRSPTPSVEPCDPPSWVPTTPGSLSEESSNHNGYPAIPEVLVSPVCSRSWYDQSHEIQPIPSTEALEVLQELTDLVASQNMRREDLMNNELAVQLYPFVPYDDEGFKTSLGSILHAEGMCKPCAFLKKERCHKKDLCLYCHFSHDVTKAKAVIPRQSQAKRKRVARQLRKHQITQAMTDGIVRFSL